MSLVTLTPTMTSLEIAELVDSRHDKVKQSIERLAERGAIALPPAGEVTNTGPGPKTISVYHVGKRDSYVVVAQLSPEFTAKLVDRWQELESRAADPMKALADPATLRQMLLGYTETVLKLEAQVAAAAPAVAFVDKFVQADGLKGFRETCKLLKANEARFTEFVLAKKIMYRLAGKLTAHQQHIDAGRFEVRAGVATATEHAYTTTKFTPKGVNWIAGEWAKHQLVTEAVEA